MKILILLIALGASNFSYAQSTTTDKKKKVITYQYEKDIDKSLEEYSKTTKKNLTPLKKKFITDLLKKNFAEQKALREEQRRSYLSFWNKAPAIFKKEWALYEAEVTKLEAQITPGDFKNNAEIYRKMNSERIKTLTILKDEVFTHLNHINEVTGRLQFERNVQLKEKILRILEENPTE